MSDFRKWGLRHHLACSRQRRGPCRGVGTVEAKKEFFRGHGEKQGEKQGETEQGALCQGSRVEGREA